MYKYAVSKAKTNLSNLIKRVEMGEQFTITRHGIPVARLIPAEGALKSTPGDVVAEIKRLREGITLNGLRLRDMIEEGRRW